MVEIEYHRITAEFMEHLKVRGEILDEHLSLALQTDFYILHLEFRDHGATLGFLINRLAISQLYPLYQLMIKRINESEHGFCNIGVSIFNQKNISINTFIPNNVISAAELINFYEYADSKLLISLN